MVTRRELIAEFTPIVGKQNVLFEPEDLMVYGFDGTIEKSLPYAVVFPETAAATAAVVRACNDLGMPVTPRGAGTGLSGGAVPQRRGVVISTMRMRSIVEIDPFDRVAVVEPGLPNIELSEAAAAYGLFYAPDPSSQKACTIGGNVAENAGGPHCLALGVTTNHVLGIEVVTAAGDLVWIGGRTADAIGYDLRGIFIGSEGTLGIATKILVRLLPTPASIVTLLATFETVEQASRAVSAIIGEGVIPAAMEMIDGLTLQAVEAGLRCGYGEAGAVLLVELDGLPEVIGPQSAAVRAQCLESGANEVRAATDPKDRELLWRGRKGAIGALGWIQPNYYILDGVVPRSKLVEVMAGVGEVSARYGLPIANVFHAGDGNLHPCVLFDDRIPGAREHVLEAGAEIMRLCVDAGGTLSGEHGIGYEKQGFMPWLYDPIDLENMERLRPVFGNTGDFNPCKILPAGTGCGEMAHQEAAVRAAGPDAYV
ncbi:MAG: FAD-linked oxidase C-terminal domain-containing protein [Tepidiformaceae bacterium]